MYFYNAYGLNIQAALPLPELVASDERSVAAEGKIDVIVRFGKINNRPGAETIAYRYIYPTSEGIYLAWPDVGAFLVRDGREIVVEPIPGVEERVLRLFILGTTLAMLLHQRGELVIMHASAVIMSGRATAFIGVKGMGKSTLAAALHARGYQLLTDDILAIDQYESCPSVLPGFPHLKLWPDSLALLGYHSTALPRLRPELEKRGLWLGSEFPSQPVPLGCIYVLGEGPQPMIKPLSPQDAWARLMPHWYGARFGGQVLEALGVSSHFSQCASLAKNVNVHHLVRPRSLSSLPALVRLVEGHTAEL